MLLFNNMSNDNNNTEIKTLIFTDGSSLNNADKDKRRAGSGCFIAINEKPIVSISKFLNKETNNYAELYAVFISISWILNSNRYNVDLPKNIEYYIDSKYVLDILIQKTKNINKNKKIIYNINKLLLTAKEEGYIFNFNHVRAHTNKKDFISKCNDHVDKIAKKAAETGEGIYIRHDKANK